MRNLYVCEKCGATYEDYDACYACENSHINIDSFQEYEDTAPTWKPGSIMPETVVLKSANIWNEKTQEYEQKYGIYKFQKLLSDKECEKIEEANRIRKEEANRQWEEYRAKREEKKEGNA